MSEFKKLQQQLAQQIYNARSATELKQVASGISDEVTKFGWSEAQRQRKDRNAASEKEYREAWQQRLDADRAKRSQE